MLWLWLQDAAMRVPSRPSVTRHQTTLDRGFPMPHQTQIRQNQKP